MFSVVAVFKNALVYNFEHLKTVLYIVNLVFEPFLSFRTTDSKLNNFTRLEPTFRTLEIPFNSITAHEVMNEKPGVATRLLYQLYIALSNKEEANLTGVAMETMRPRAPVKLESMERGPYKEVLTFWPGSLT